MALDPDNLIDDVTVILLAGGAGERLGSSRPKAFVGLGGRVLLAHSLEVFERHPAVDAIVLVVPEDWVGPAEVLVDDLGCSRVSSIEVGGASRAASVRAGLSGVPDRRGTAVLVHDSARPLVSDGVIERVLDPLADGYDAAVPVLDVVDTVKRVQRDTGEIVETISRSDLRRAQTPQACRASALHAALDDLDDDALASITDCSYAIEQRGGRTISVPGDEELIKVTTRADLAQLERIVAERGAAVTLQPDSGEFDDSDSEEPE